LSSFSRKTYVTHGEICGSRPAVLPIDAEYGRAIDIAAADEAIGGTC